jgi:hypothetical protein
LVSVTGGSPMFDILFLVALVAFFFVGALFVHACERM